MNFDRAFQVLMVHEGGFSKHAADTGGKTMFGITEAVARRHGYTGDMAALPADLAKRIYRVDYWDAVSADRLPPGIRYVVFDAAVNSGVRQSVRWLQRALGVHDDGVIGPVTLAAADQQNADALRARLLAQRLKFMAELMNWPAFGRGWARRIADLMESA